jgi:hypothetical protein
MEHDPADAAPAEEVFDHELASVLEARGTESEGQGRVLLATGAVSVAGRGVILHARLRLSRWRRRGWLEIAAEDPVSGNVKGTSPVAVGHAGRNRASLIEEIAIHLAAELAHGYGSGGPR